MKKLLLLFTVLLITVSTFAQKEKVYLTVHTTIFIKNNVRTTDHTVRKIELNSDSSHMKLISPGMTNSYLIFKNKAYTENEFFYVEGTVIETTSRATLRIHLTANVLSDEFHITLSGFNSDDYDTLILIAK